MRMDDFPSAGAIGGSAKIAQRELSGGEKNQAPVPRLFSVRAPAFFLYSSAVAPLEDTQRRPPPAGEE